MISLLSSIDSYLPESGRPLSWAYDLDRPLYQSSGFDRTPILSLDRVITDPDLDQIGKFMTTDTFSVGRQRSQITSMTNLIKPCFSQLVRRVNREILNKAMIVVQKIPSKDCIDRSVRGNGMFTSDTKSFGELLAHLVTQVIHFSTSRVTFCQADQ